MFTRYVCLPADVEAGGFEGLLDGVSLEPPGKQSLEKAGPGLGVLGVKLIVTWE